MHAAPLLLVVLALVSTSVVQVAAFPFGGKVDFSKWTPTDRTKGAPCPLMNSLANHGFVPREGITADQLYKALTDVAKVDPITAKIFTDGGMKIGRKNAEGVQVLNLRDLATHGPVEHDASMTRDDLASGDNYNFNPEFYAKMKSFSKDGQYLTLDDLAAYRRFREAESKRRYPSTFTFGEAEQKNAYGEVGLLVSLLKDDTGNVPLKWADVFLQSEKFPIEQGWQPRLITLLGVKSIADQVASKAAKLPSA